LCLLPKAWTLLNPLANRWGVLACRYPTTVALASVFVPNGLAGAFNYHYNLAWLTARHPNGHDALIYVSIVLNIVSFGLGGVFFLMVVWPVTREVSRRTRLDRRVDSTFIQRAMRLGHTASIFGISLWLIAGLIFPALLSMRIPAFDYQDAIHFFLSLAVCGAIAVAYPFLGLSLLTTQFWYGLLIGASLQDIGFRERGSAWRKWSDRYLIAATAVPLAGLAMLLTQSSPVHQALIALVAASAFGLFIAFHVHRRIQESLDLLAKLLDQPNGAS
jgi:eukaryotic-like serine/threonine-protein kinase